MQTGKRFWVYLSLVSTMFLWGGTFIAGRLLKDAISPAPAAFIRFGIAAATLSVLLRLFQEKLPRPTPRQWLGLIMLGATGVFGYNICFFYGLQSISAGRAALIIATTPLCISMLAFFFFNERLTFLKVAGIFLSLTGALFVIANGHPTTLFSGSLGKGELAIIGCVINWSAYSLIGRKMLFSFSPMASVYYSCLLGSLLLFPMALLSGLFEQIQDLQMDNWMAIGYLGIFGTALGFSWYYHAIKSIGATQAGVFINLVPVFAVLLSWFMLEESLRLSVLLGGMMILSGVSVTNYAAARRERS